MTTTTPTQQQTKRTERLPVGINNAEIEATEKRIETVTSLLDEFAERLQKGIDRIADLEERISRQLRLTILCIVALIPSLALILLARELFTTGQGIIFYIDAIVGTVGLLCSVIGILFHFPTYQYLNRKRQQWRNDEKIVLRHSRKLLTRAMELTDLDSDLSFEQRLSLDFRIADTEALLAQLEDGPNQMNTREQDGSRSGHLIRAYDSNKLPSEVKERSA